VHTNTRARLDMGGGNNSRTTRTRHQKGPGAGPCAHALARLFLEGCLLIGFGIAVVTTTSTAIANYTQTHNEGEEIRSGKERSKQSVDKTLRTFRSGVVGRVGSRRRGTRTGLQRRELSAG
jgi:hypothetical protein